MSDIVIKRSKRMQILCCWIAAGMWLNGCGGTSNVEGPRRAKAPASQQEIDNFSVFLEIVSNFSEFEPVTARRKALINLNRWAENQDEDPDWSPDDLVSRVPEHFRNHELLSTLDRLKFDDADIQYIQECIWFRDLAGWVSRPEQNVGTSYLVEQVESGLDEEKARELDRADDKLAAVLQNLDAELTREDAGRLAVAMRLFDWTIRNTQLDPLLPKPKEFVGPRDDAPAEIDDERPVAEITQAGPGYQQFPWQVLLYGHGDALQRARIFMLLARQLQIDVIMLGYAETGRTTLATAWLTAVDINGRLFLFDTALGIPIPGQQTPIATLAEVKENPALLDNLDAKDDEKEYKYPVTEKELQQLVAMIDAAPQCLSQRMQRVEQRLSGENKMVLAIDASRLSEKMRHEHGLNVGLWTVPFETVIFRELLSQVMERNPRIRRIIFQAEDVFVGIHPLANGRRKHFEGILESNEQKNESGAKSLYLEARKPNEEIRNLKDNEDLQRQHGVLRMPGESKSAWELRVEYLQAFFGITRIHAGYWLAIAHFDAGGYPDAIKWFEYTVERGKQAEAWKGSINYNMARAYEEIGAWETAVELLLADDSPQRHGCLVRGRLLQERYGSGSE